MRTIQRTVLIGVILGLVAVQPARAVQAAAPAKVELLWPDGAPGAKGSAEGDKPTLTIYLPADKATGTAVVICPGGGYGHLATDHEGRQVAQWLNSLGVAGFILEYRHRNTGAGYGHPAPLQDAQRAIRIVRSKAVQWNINPNRIGILGFSAGGHLASTAGTHFDKDYYSPRDRIDQVSCRPDFMILVYPVVTMSDDFTHGGSKRNLLGPNPDKELTELLSNEKQVTSRTPPTFLIHTYEDTAVPAENSVNLFLALRKAKVPCEMHIYLKGPHGFGLGQNRGPVSNWPTQCAEWMRGLNFAL